MHTTSELNNLKATVVIGTTSNEGRGYAPIVPERFGSTSAPNSGPVVSPELNSVSEPKVQEGVLPAV